MNGRANGEGQERPQADPQQRDARGRAEAAEQCDEDERRAAECRDVEREEPDTDVEPARRDDRCRCDAERERLAWRGRIETAQAQREPRVLLTVVSQPVVHLERARVQQ